MTPLGRVCIFEDVRRIGTVRVLAAEVVALAFVLAAVGPCLCLLDRQDCHGDVEAMDAASHACCEKPFGVQAAVDECCDAESDLVAAATDVPGVSPPTLQTGSLDRPPAGEGAAAVGVARTPPPLALDRTTVLLI